MKIKKHLSTLLILMLLLTVTISNTVHASNAPYLIDVSVSSGEISPDVGKLVLTFSAELDFDTLSGICFTKADGNQLKGGAIVVRGASDDEVRVLFGLLETGSYKLSVTPDLKGADGTPAATQSVDYTVSAENALGILYKPDLDSIEPSVYTKAEFDEYITPGFAGAGAGFARYEVVSGSDGKYISTYLHEPTAQSGTSYAVRLPSYYTSGTYRLKFQFKSAADILNRNLVTFRKSRSLQNDENQCGRTLQTSGTNGLQLAINSVLTMAESNTYICTLDSEGFMSLCFEIGRESATDDWSITVTDEYSDSAVIATGSIGANTMKAIEHFTLFDTWPHGSFLAEGLKTCIKDISFEELFDQKIVYADSIVQPDADSVKVLLFRDDSIANVALTLTSFDGDAVDADIRLTNGRLVSVIPKDYLKYDTEYTISFDSGFAEDVIFTTTSRKLSVSSPVIEEGKAKVTLSASDTAEHTATVYVAAKDSQGKIKAVTYTVSEPFTVTSAVEVDISDISGVSYTIIVWDNESGYSTLVPLPEMN